MMQLLPEGLLLSSAIKTHTSRNINTQITDLLLLRSQCPLWCLGTVVILQGLYSQVLAEPTVIPESYLGPRPEIVDSPEVPQLKIFLDALKCCCVCPRISMGCPCRESFRGRVLLSLPVHPEPPCSHQGMSVVPTVLIMPLADGSFLWREQPHVLSITCTYLGEVFKMLLGEHVLPRSFPSCDASGKKQLLLHECKFTAVPESGPRVLWVPGTTADTESPIRSLKPNPVRV